MPDLWKITEMNDGVMAGDGTTMKVNGIGTLRAQSFADEISGEMMAKNAVLVPGRTTNFIPVS